MERKNRAIVLWTWVAKGLIVRNHAEGISMVRQIFQLFNGKDDIADFTARKLAILSDPKGDGILSKEKHAVYKASDDLAFAILRSAG